MLCSVRLALFWSFLRIAVAEADVCRDQGACKDSLLLRRQQTKILRNLLRKNGAVLNSNVIIESEGGRSSCLARKSIQKGDLLFEIPLAVVLRRSAWLKPQKNVAWHSGLSEMEGLVLHLAMLMKDWAGFNILSCFVMFNPILG